MRHPSRRVLSLLILVAFLVSVYPPSVTHGQTVGTVCVEPQGTSTSGCTAPPVTLGGLGATVGSTIVVAVNIQGSDFLNGFRIFVKTDITILNPVKADLSNILLPQPILPLANCVNGAGTGCSLSSGDGPGVVDIGLVTLGTPPPPPVTGGLFEITYTVTALTQGSPVGFLAGCSGSSVSGSCITITNGGSTATPENAQTATFSNQAPPPDFSLAVSPTSGGVVQGSTASTLVTANIVSGTPGSVAFGTSTLPSGVTVTFSPTSCTPTCSSKLTFSATTTATTGAVTVTITGTASGIQPKTATYTLTVQQLQKDFTIAANPSSLTIIQGGLAQTSDIDLTGSNGFADTIQLTTKVSGSGGPQASLSTNTVALSSTSTSAASTLSVSASATANLGTFTVTVNGIGVATGTSHSIPVLVTIVAPTASPDFALSANPTSLFIAPGNLGPSLITVRSLNGFAGTLTFTTSIFPSGATVSLSQKTVTLIARGSWTLVAWVFTTTGTAPGTYTLTVTATDGSISHSLKITVTVL